MSPLGFGHWDDEDKLKLMPSFRKDRTDFKALHAKPLSVCLPNLTLTICRANRHPSWRYCKHRDPISISHKRTVEEQELAHVAKQLRKRRECAQSWSPEDGSSDVFCRIRSSESGWLLTGWFHGGGKPLLLSELDRVLKLRSWSQLLFLFSRFPIDMKLPGMVSTASKQARCTMPASLRLPWNFARTFK